ncbi:MAG: hypothetical protein JEZ12_21980 [Desulfobacterium sp.]|nr:hypothetical protein [Desulfobacterium sp.]
MNDFLQNLRGNQKDNRAAAKTRRGFDNNQQQNQHYNNPPAHFHSNNTYQNSRVGNGKRPIRSNPQNQVGDSQPVMISSEVVENLTALAETMLKNQEFLGAAQERLAAAEERKVDFLAEIAEYLRVIAAPGLQDDERFEEERYAREERVEESFDEPEYGCVEEVEAVAEVTVEREVEVPRVAETPAPVKKRRGRKPNAVKLAEAKAAAEASRVEPVKVLKRTKAQKLKAVQKSTAKTELLSRDAVLKIVNGMREKGATFDQVAQHLVELGQPTFSGRGEWHAQTVHRLCNSQKK